MVWFHRESFETLLDWLAAAAAIDALETGPNASRFLIAERLSKRFAAIAALREAMERSGHRLEELRAAIARLGNPEARTPPVG